jgi:hypothetical protein
LPLLAQIDSLGAAIENHPDCSGFWLDEHTQSRKQELRKMHTRLLTVDMMLSISTYSSAFLYISERTAYYVKLRRLRVVFEVCPKCLPNA